MGEGWIMSKILLIIPAYNEENHIGSVLDRALSLKELYSSLDLLVIDDGSEDCTAEIARAKGVDVVRHDENGGEEAAIQTGFDYALKHNYDFVVKLDGDGQHIPSEVTKILDPLCKNEADVVVGSRLSGYSELLLFKLGRTFCSIMVSLLLRKKIADPTSGLKGRNHLAVKYSRMLYTTTKSLHNDMVNDIEELLWYSKKKMRIKEVVVKMNRREEASKCYCSTRMLKFPFVLFITILRSLLTVTPQRSYKRHESP